MNNIEEYLSQFEDFELAFFCKYKLDTYMQETQNKIIAYAKQRNLNETRMNDLIEEYSHKLFPANEVRCPRCKSEKLITNYRETFNPLNTNYSLVKELIDYKDATSRDVTYSCIVCGFSFLPIKNYSFFRKILNFILFFIVPGRYS
jgi:hypothetical protein